MTDVMFTSAAFDSSGYAEASRNYICALAQQEDVNISLRVKSFENWKTKLPQKQLDIMRPLVNKELSSLDTQIIHLTPENFPAYIIPGIKNIGYTVWETSRLPGPWVPLINQLDEVWVPCDWNVQVFQESGVTIPIKRVPHTFDSSSFETNSDREFNIPENRFTFYSIFQWSARKNPEALLQAYLTEFTKNDPVCLVLKTYKLDNSERDKSYIIDQINTIKRKLWLQNTPPIVLVHEMLSRDEIIKLHQTCDCFVLPHRAEGWGIPHFEAMACNNYCISTGYSGNLEFMNNNNSFLVNYNLTPCYGMDRPTYDGTMMWAEPHIDSLRKQMRRVFEQERLSKSTGFSKKILKEDPSLVLDTFGWHNVGQQMKRLLENK